MQVGQPERALAQVHLEAAAGGGETDQAGIQLGHQDAAPGIRTERGRGQQFRRQAGTRVVDVRGHLDGQDGQRRGIGVTVGADAGRAGHRVQSSRWVRSSRSWRSCASIESVAMGRASSRLMAIGSPVSSQ